jgi:predicted amidophosphoribosyltransferase
MSYKNINQTTEKQTIIPIWYIDIYKNTHTRNIFDQYKFKNKSNNKYLLNIATDICINTILDYSDYNIIFTYPPSTMFYRKEKNIDSMGNLVMQVKKYLCFYFKTDNNNYSFKNIFSIDKKHLKNKKAQHIDGTRKTRTKNLNERYYVNFWNKRYLKNICKNSKVMICIIDDVSSTGGTLLACKNSLGSVIGDDIRIELYSLAH